MDLAPGRAEQAALYIELFTFSALSIVLFLVGIIFNWRIARGLTKAVARLAPPQIGGFGLRETVEGFLAQWQDEFRRVRRTATFLFATALLGFAFAVSTIITIAGTHERDDGVASQWQRWTGYTFGMVVMTAAMAQYYAIETVATWIFALLPAAAGMLMGIFVSLTSLGTANGVGKVVNFSIWGPFFLIVLIPLFYLYTTYDIWGRWWRGFPIVLHVAFAIALWIILWAGPEVGGPNNQGARTAAAWGYFIVVLVWVLAMIAVIYFWRMGPPKRRTAATDAVVVKPTGTARRGGRGRAQAHRVVNLKPSSPHYAPGPTVPATKPAPVESTRGRFGP